MRNYFSENEEKVEKKNNNFIVFSVDKEDFSININNVVEIIKMQELTYVPDLPEHMAGIINVRDKFYPITDLRIRFRKERNQYTERTCIILIEYNNLNVGIIVDDIKEVIAVKDDDMKEAPKENSGFYNRFIKKIIYKNNDEYIFVLDCDALFINEEEYIKEINSDIST